MQGQQPAGAFQQPEPVLGRLHPAGAAQQQRLAQGFLQPADLHGNGGLGAAHRLRGAGEAAALGDQHEAAEQVGVQPGRNGEHD